MVNINRVVLAGNLTRDPLLRQIREGVTVGSFGLAINEHHHSPQGEERTETCFVDIEVWGKQADSCQQYLRKGAAAVVEGRLRSESWEDRASGARRSKLVLRASRVHFLGGAQNPRPPQAAPGPQARR